MADQQRGDYNPQIKHTKSLMNLLQILINFKRNDKLM